MAVHRVVAALALATVCLSLVLAAGTVAGPVAGAERPTTASAGPSPDAPHGEADGVRGVVPDGAAGAPETDTTVVDVDVFANGTATWELRVRTRLRTDGDVADYRRFQEAFRNDTDAYLDPFRQRMTGVVADAESATGRPMNASNFTASTRIQEVPRRWGIVAFQFRWSGFANASGDRVAVGDVFEGGLFLSENDSVKVTGPPGYEVAASDPSPDDVDGRTLIWFGRADFDDRRPRAVFERATTVTPGDTATPGDQGTVTTPPGPTGTPTNGTPGGAGDDAGGDGGGSSSLLLGGLVVVALLGAGAVAVGLRRRDAVDGGATSADAPDGDASDSAATTGGESGADATTGAGAAAGAAAAGGDDDTVPPELLTDEDRVRRLLTDRGGRMKQADVAETLDWSASKTSRVLSEMADEGAVEKLRIGRENVIDLVEDGDGTDPYE